MKTVNIAELKNRLSVYIKIARRGEEVIIRDRNLPVAKLVPFPTGDATEDELLLVAEGKMRLSERPLDWDAFWKIPTGTVPGNAAVEAVLQEREESW